jgi:DNA-directed RNA polymerase specialized sigma24 family protein
VDNVLSGALGASPEAGGQASGTEPGRLAAAAEGGWPDVALIYRQHHADLVRLALLLVGDRASAEDVVQDVFTRHALATGCWHKTARWLTSGRRS